jgi:hypothetical protein
MSGTINGEAAQPTTTQGFEHSDRNPQVMKWGGTESDGRQVPAPRESGAGTIANLE